MMRVLTVRQPWADLIMSGQKPVENRSWAVPTTLPQWWRCRCLGCGHRTRFAPEVTNARHVHGDVAADDPMEPDGPFPFTLGIHAAAKVQWRRGADATRSDLLVAWSQWSTRANPALGYPVTATVPLTGVLLGTVEVTGCHHSDDTTACRPRGSRPLCGSLDTDGAGPCVLSPPIGDGSAHVHHGAEDVGRDLCSRWSELDAWHWTLADPVPLATPIPAKGALGLWRPDAQVAAHLDQAVTHA